MFISDINDCSPMPCQNSATCHDGVNSYTCSCATGWTGVNCESGEYTLADLDLDLDLGLQMTLN